MRRLLFLAVLACGAPQPVAVVVPVAVAPSSAPVVASVKLPAAQAVRQRVVPPDTNGCLVHAEAPFAPHALRLRPNDPPYATVTATHDERVLFHRGGTVPYVELETADGGLRLRGYADLAPRATKAFALGGVIVPRKKTRLRWNGTTDDGHVTVALALPPTVTVDGGHVVSGLAPCDALTVLADDTSEERPDEELDKAFSVDKMSLTVRADPAGAVRATVDWTAEGGLLGLGEVRGAVRRADLPFDDFIVRGWVPTKLPGLTATSQGTLGMGGKLGQYLMSFGVPSCATPLAVYAKRGDAFLEVGTVAALFPVKRAENFGEYARIDIGRPPKDQLPWYARTTDLEACTARSEGGGGPWRFE